LARPNRQIRRTLNRRRLHRGQSGAWRAALSRMIASQANAALVASAIPIKMKRADTSMPFITILPRLGERSGPG
jgi:hypothetical protein